MTLPSRRRWYILTCVILLMLWIWLGHFEAVEAPYVQF
jgi:hypothetical protein